MPVKRFKDRTGLVATRSLLASHVYERVEGSPSRRYFALYLWEKAEQLRRGALLDGRAMGCHCPTPVRYHFDENGVETASPRLLLGELHFAAGHWTDEIVAHELMHAFFEADRSGVGTTRIGDLHLDDTPFGHEEEWCYRFGRWFSVVYKWLWTEDPTLALGRISRRDL